jgi:hypothetical protein
MKLNNLNELKLSEDMHKLIKTSIEEHKMLWEPWIESCDDFQQLKKNLKKRGLKNVPTRAAPIINKKESVDNNSKKKLKTMLRKKD